MAARSDELRMTLLCLALLGLLLTAAPVEATGGVRQNSFSMNTGGARTLNSFSMNGADGGGKGAEKSTGAGGDGF